MNKETIVIGFSAVFMAIITAVYFHYLILNPPDYNSWVDHDRWYDLTLQTT
jgi:hypothetical protein